MIETMDGNAEHATRFAGLPVLDWEPGTPLRDPRDSSYRLRLEFKEGDAWSDMLTAFLDDPLVGQVTSIVVGAWWDGGSRFHDSSAVITNLVAACHRLPNLTAIFLGDLTSEECEISWLQQSDVSPLLQAYPHLQHLSVRGADGLSFGTLRHTELRSLTIQCGGLPTSVLGAVLAAHLPSLGHLELWLGTEDYGWDSTIDDLVPLLSGNLFPKLRYLGLRDSEIADQVAIALAQAPILERLEVLDLSLGTLTDEGALALLKCPVTPRLKKLDIHHHYCSKAMVAELRRLGIEVDGSGRQEPETDGDEEWRYVAVGE